MINFEHDAQMRPSTHNPEMEQQVNQLWNDMITGGQERPDLYTTESFDRMSAAKDEIFYGPLLRDDILAHIKRVESPQSVHTLALYESVLRRRIAADIDFEDINIDSDEARDRVYEGILETEKRHRKLRREDFTKQDADMLQRGLRDYRSGFDPNDREKRIDLSEGYDQYLEQVSVLADAITLGYDPNDIATRLLKNNGQEETYYPMGLSSVPLKRSQHHE